VKAFLGSVEGTGVKDKMIAGRGGRCVDCQNQVTTMKDQLHEVQKADSNVFAQLSSTLQC
jgi:hypothetical protein